MQPNQNPDLTKSRIGRAIQISFESSDTLQCMRYKYMNKTFSSFSEAIWDSFFYAFSLAGAML